MAKPRASVGAKAAAAFRENADTQEVTLPSGITVSLKKPDLIGLIAADGDIPNALVGVFMQGLAVPAQDNPDFGADELRGLFKLANTITRAAFVEPRIVDKPDSDLEDNEIRIDHVDFNDRVYVLNWAIGSDGAAVSTFRQKQAGRVDAVSAGQDVQSEAE